jgi:phosphopantothenoylcysteine synthetase/decarboxylase
MKILLGITGSISAYKTYDLCRGLVKAGHEVQVILTKGALEFIQPNTFKYLGAKSVFYPGADFDLTHYDESNKSNVLHIHLSKWCDKFIIAPLSANTLGKLAGGLCDDLLSSVFLALDKKTSMFFPAMNTKMLEHPFVQENLDKLSSLENSYVHPTQSGLLACGDEGFGKLAPVDEIKDLIETYNPNKEQKKYSNYNRGNTIASRSCSLPHKSILRKDRLLSGQSLSFTGSESKSYLNN